MAQPQDPESYSASPPKYGRIARLRGFLPLNNEDSSPLSTHGQGTLTALISSRSSASLSALTRRASSLREPDEETGLLGRRSSRGEEDGEEFAGRMSGDERRVSLVLNTPQMRSQRLIGNSNPRYQWEKYWKTEETLKSMKKPM